MTGLTGKCLWPLDLHSPQLNMTGRNTISVSGQLPRRFVLICLAECNNSTTFPGIGLGAVLSRTKLLTPSLIVAAVRALAAKSPISNGTGSGLLPDVTDVREISVQIAKNVIQQAVKEDLAQEKDIPTEDADLEEWIREQMWDAEYRPLKLVKDHEGDTFARGEAGTASQNRMGSFNWTARLG